jgi:transposase
MTGANRGGKYPDEMRERGVRMVFEHQDEYPSQWRAIESVAKKLGVNHETMRKWVRAAEVDGGKRPGVGAELDRQSWR